MHVHHSHHHGFSFVEVLVTAALVSLVFGSLFTAVNGMIILIQNSKAKAGATALVVERLEYIRSLPYNSIGTVSGVPAGLIPQLSTTTLNGVVYQERVLVEYVDDVADGFGGADLNGILSDYKRIKVELTYSVRNATSSVSLVTTVVPIGIESTAGGGTIRVNVFDANTTPVSGAEVRFVNTTTTTTIDTIRYTNIDGIAYLAGAPAAANYQIFATKAGYSLDQTYSATTTNPNPATPLVTVTESLVSTMNFIIDELSSLTIQTVGVPTFGFFDDSFSDVSLVATSSNVTFVSNEVRLSESAGIYASSGSVLSTSTEPGTLDRWYTLSFSASTTASTSVRVSLYYDNSGILTLVPESELLGNSTGFSSSPINIQNIDASIYDGLMIGATLTTSDASQTPVLHEWELQYVSSQPTVSGIPIDVQGAKVIGTDASSNPLYKFDNSYVTDGSGEVELIDIEYDLYTVTMSGSDKVIEACPVTPYYLEPNTSEVMTVTLDSLSGSFLRVIVTDPAGDTVSGASVQLQNTGYDETNVTSLCGQTYFTGGGLYNAGDFEINVSKAGYNASSVSSTTVSNNAVSTVIISPI